ncbi:MAG: hypothetical protein J6575_03630 [Bifidobacterium sp.]|nr:hypothetical protein [Bifidobacterium sp.]
MSEDSKTGKPDRLLWIDIETTGLDPEQDRILEVEMRVTDMDGTGEYGRFHAVVPCGERLDISKWALATHSANGLLEASTKIDGDETHVASKFFAFVKETARHATLHPAGSSVHFDLAFLMPWIGNLLDHGIDHRWMDKSSVLMFLQAAKAPIPETGDTDHRTRTCLDRDIAQYRKMLDVMMGLQCKPAVSDTDPTDPAGQLVNAYVFDLMTDDEVPYRKEES